MKTTCLISCHNYRRFVGEAVDSALAQSKPFDQIIVVDDGSTDGSLEFLRQRYRDCDRVQIVAKSQGGQLSCFHHGFDQSTGDVVFFLDADDRLCTNYVQRAMAIYEEFPYVDFLSVNYQSFGLDENYRPRYRINRYRGLSVLATLYHRDWVGMPTSCLSMRSSLLAKVLPFPFESEWITRADDVLIFGSSLVGGQKYDLADKLVEYRVHPSNNFAKRKHSGSDKMQYSLRVNRLMHWYLQQVGLHESSLPSLLHREFRSIERPTATDFRRYLRMTLRSRQSMVMRIEQAAVITAHMCKELVRHWRSAATMPAVGNSELIQPVVTSESADRQAA